MTFLPTPWAGPSAWPDSAELQTLRCYEPLFVKIGVYLGHIPGIAGGSPEASSWQNAGYWGRSSSDCRTSGSHCSHSQFSQNLVLIGRTAPWHVHGHDDEPAFYLREGVRSIFRDQHVITFGDSSRRSAFEF